MFQVTKTYGHNLGLSTTFRQWRATSHCRFLHGYALQVEIKLASHKLNYNNWVVDFGSLKPFKQWLSDTFDHKTLVALDDPALHEFRVLADAGLIDLVEVEATGCEGFARMIHDKLLAILNASAAAGQLQGGYDNGVWIRSVEVREHAGNSATYAPDANLIGF